ncbi:MAG: hypothetical protein GXX89_06000 [Clostridiales bacterium]|nr:hypothetical protein [Clostridiales bacterium]
MTKGKFGLSLAAVAVISFGFVALRQPQCVLLVAGFALLAEKDEWLNRQVMQAILLTVAYYLVDLVIGWIFGGIARLFSWSRLYGAAGAMSSVDAVLSDLVYIALIVLCVIAVLRLVRGKDAAIPFISKMAGGDFTAAFAARPKAPAAPAQAVPSVYTTPQQTTAAPVQPGTQPQAASAPQAGPAVQTAPVATPAPAVQPPAPVQNTAAAPQSVTAPRTCRVCSSVLGKEARFCTVCGTKAE